mmetsp:Transcript_3185/g.8088  ORF Transcript_3185/g.8088 Transcript_3185/m.8088 type:complete len:220 (+) Transcript_3185:243-902(+)
MAFDCKVNPSSCCCFVVPCCWDLRTGILALSLLQVLLSLALLTGMGVMANIQANNVQDQGQATARVARYLIDEIASLVVSILLLLAGVFGLLATSSREMVVRMDPYVLSAARKHYGLNLALLIMLSAAGLMSAAYSTLLILEWPDIAQKDWAIAFVWISLTVVLSFAGYFAFVSWSFMKRLQLAKAGELEGDFVVREDVKSKAKSAGKPSAQVGGSAAA